MAKIENISSAISRCSLPLCVPLLSTSFCSRRLMAVGVPLLLEFHSSEHLAAPAAPAAPIVDGRAWLRLRSHPQGMTLDFSYRPEAETRSNTMCNYAKHMQGLQQAIHKMIILSLGLEEYYDSHIKSVAYSMRLSEYFNDEQNKESEIGLPTHVDSNYLSIILQLKEGLQIESPNHEWIRATPLPNSFTVLLGEAFMAWTNRRFRAPNHRVMKMDGSSKRYSIIFSSIPSLGDDMIRTLDELVDNSHPLIYKPFQYYDYLKYRFSNGEKEDTLKSYCGVEQPEAAA